MRGVTFYPWTGRFAGYAARYKTALRHFEELLNLSRHEHGERSPKTATALNNLADVLRATGRYTEAESLHRQAAAPGHDGTAPIRGDGRRGRPLNAAGLVVPPYARGETLGARDHVGRVDGSPVRAGRDRR